MGLQLATLYLSYMEEKGPVAIDIAIATPVPVPLAIAIATPVPVPVPITTEIELIEVKRYWLAKILYS